MGPFTLSKTGEKFVVTFIDNFSHFVMIELLKKKSDVPAAFARYHKKIEKKFPGQLLHILDIDTKYFYTIISQNRHNVMGIADPTVASPINSNSSIILSSPSSEGDV